MGMKVGLSMTMNDAPITHNSFNDGGSVVDLNELNFL